MKKVITELTLPIPLGRKSMDVLLQEDKIFKKYNFDFEKMYEENIIDQFYFISEIIYNFKFFFKEDIHKFYRLIKKGEQTKYMVVYDEDDCNYCIIDITKKMKKQDYRRTPEYKIWRDKVFKRDKYTCQHCGKRGKLNAHHIKFYKDYPELRYVVDNGLTLCKECHNKEHKRLRGIKNARVD